jgi:hypothetical protein
MSDPNAFVGDNDARRNFSQYRRQVWWHQQYIRREQQQKKEDDLKEARRVAEIIRQRNLLTREDDVATGMGYGILLGGMTVLAVSLPLVAVSRVVPSSVTTTIGHRAVHIGTRSIALAAGIHVGHRYVRNERTKHHLKVMGTYLTPNEPCVDADIICQHPAIVQAIERQKKEGYWYRPQQQQQPVQRTYQTNYRYGDVSPWPATMTPPFSKRDEYLWWTKSVQEEDILEEYRNVLCHCEQRAGGIQRNNHDAAASIATTTNSNNHTKAGSPATATSGGFRKRLW